MRKFHLRKYCYLVLWAALLAAVAGGWFFGRGPEPLPEDHPLWSAKNTIITPHASGNMTLGYTCDENVARFCADLENYAAGRPLAGLVDRNRGY